MNLVKYTPPRIVRDEEIVNKTSFDKFQVEENELEESITVVYEVSN